ncbi:MAG: class I SAM-dependent methyltransferase [Candidatus Rokubacteria bacterium]|nr:class I SAM-dependent methyltransferase [Candidatus Rokubacteria bacterium]
MERLPADPAETAAPPPAGVSPAWWRLVLAGPLRQATVLDVGTGRGRIALALAPLARRVIGIDRDAAAIADARCGAAALGLPNVDFLVRDAEGPGYEDLEPGLVTAHLCMSDAIAAHAGRALPPGGLFAVVAFHTDQWKETGRASRFAYDEDRMRGVLEASHLSVEQLDVERHVECFGSVEEALAAAVGLQEKWQADGRWFRYIKFLEEGGRTLTRARLVVTARRR